MPLLLFPPLLRQLAGGGGGEDGLAEAFEDGGDAVEAFATGVYPREDRVELVGDALLFVEGGDPHRNSFDRSLCEHVETSSTAVTNSGSQGA